MSAREHLIDAITQTLTARKLDVERIGDTLNVKDGPGRLASKVNVDLGGIIERLGQRPEQEHARQLAGFVSGVRAVLAEPARSKAAQWTYEQTAGRIAPTVEVDTFVLGVQATGLGTPWHVVFGEDLVLVILISLDRGWRPLMREQLERWEVSDDRVYSAARSMLYHKTREVQLRAHEGAEGVFVAKVGDGYDAARGIVLTEVFFSDLSESTFRFGIPHQDTFFYVQSLDEQTLASLRRATREAYEEADYPLSASIFELAGTRPMTATPVKEEGE